MMQVILDFFRWLFRRGPWAYGRCPFCERQFHEGDVCQWHNCPMGE